MTLLVICVAIGSVGSREKTNTRRRRHKSVATTTLVCTGQKSLVLLMHERNVSIVVAATAETRPTKRSQKKNSP